MKAIIFGANGQDGFYLSNLLKGENFEVLEVSRSGNMLRVDITDFNAIRTFIAQEQPAYVFHLAANSTTRHDALFENHATISTGTLNILEAVKTQSPHTKVFISGSGLQFVNKDAPIKETDDFEARDAYSIARIQSAYAARYYRSLGIKTYVGYFFNHDSPRRTTRHVAQMIAADVLAIANGENRIIEIGDPTVKKEWTYAGDVVTAIWILVQQDAVFEATLGAGIGYSIQDYIEACFKCIGKIWQPHVAIKSGFKSEYRQLVSNPETIHKLGWQPTVNFEQLVTMMLTQKQDA
jgi:GDPmannose 4,6-dehydratase